MRLIRHTVMTLFWAGALLLTACQYESVITDLRDAERNADSLVIGFSNGVIDNPVSTRAVTLLSDHFNTMGVWGWQTTSDGLFGCLFRNQEVTFNASLDSWTYSPEKYWEKGSSYQFYAYAPHVSSVADAVVTINEETGRISITGVTLSGCNTMSTEAQPLPYGNFSSVSDIDWMIDRAGKAIPKEQIYSKVTFNMQHLLSKFNVMIKAIGALAADGTGTYAILDSMSIGSFVSKADFTQLLDHSPVPGNTVDEAAIEWKLDTLSQRYTLQSTRNVTVSATGSCIIESLLLPQNVNDSQEVTIHYTLHTSTGRAEKFMCKFNLIDAFDKFKTAHNYTLIINIGPDVITFDSGAVEWDNDNNGFGWIN